MTTEEYVLVTNLARARSAQAILRQMLPTNAGYDPAIEEARFAVGRLEELLAERQAALHIGEDETLDSRLPKA